MAQGLTMTSSNPLISVIMPVYNGEKFLRETIDSVLNQTWRDYEFIIVNDGSSDTTQQIIDSYDDKRVVPVCVNPNQGVSNARNKGVDLAKGKFIAFCDADDIYDPSRLQTQLDFLQNHPDVDICSSYFIVFENDQEVLVQHPVTDQEIKEHFFTENCIGQPCVMAKSSLFRQHKYNPALQASEDYDLWTRMAAAGAVFANIPQPLVKHRLHPAQASKAKSKLLDATSKVACINYTLAYLNNPLISQLANVTEMTLADFRLFVSELAKTCSQKSRNINTFRQLISLRYKKIDKLGLRSFLMLKSASSQYGIDFPGKYLLNIFLLSFIRIDQNSSVFNTLTKLKLKALKTNK
jgi:glycosyltransferase involved in cell wall biosynthesis